MPDQIPSPSQSAVRLTAIRALGARSADRPSDLLEIHHSSSGHGDAITQERPTSRERPISLSIMADRGKKLQGKEEQEALLPDIDAEDDGFNSSNRISPPLVKTSPQSTFTESFQADSNDGYDADPEEATAAQQRIAPDQFIKGYETTKWEIWAYYGYYVGNTGLTLAMFATMATQNLLSLAAGEKSLLPFLGRERTIDSIVLLASAISFSIQIIVFLILGSLADFGSWRSSILIVQSLIGIVIGFAWLGVHRAEQWKTAVIMYIFGLIAFQTSLAYFFAAFPALARNTPELRKKAEELSAGVIAPEEYDEADSAGRNHIANMSLWVAGAGGMGVIAIMMAILRAVDATADTANNSWGLSLVIGFGSAIWLIFAMPWFILEKRRPGRPIPPGMNIFTAGFWQVYRAGSQVRKLSQSFAYLIGFFILGESLNTSVGVVGILQNEVAKYDVTQLSQLLMVQFAAATVGLWLCIKVQKKYALTTKTMLCGIVICVIIMNLWGVLGIWTDTIGYHNIWEFWVYGLWYGGFVSPWYSYSQTMISEITPRGKDFLFFSLFNIIGKASSFVGPLISSAIIDTDPRHNPSTPFYFLTSLSVLGLLIVIFFVDLNRSRREQERFLEEERLEILAMTDDLRQKVL